MSKRLFLNYVILSFCVFTATGCEDEKGDDYSFVIKPAIGKLNNSGHGEDGFILKPFTIGPEAFNPKGSHIQGIAASEEALYLSQDCHLAKVSWNGTLILSREVVNHTGDLCWYNGELYASVALNESGGSVYSDITEGTGKIQVYDSNLNLLREANVNRRIDGICCLNGVLYVGMGAKKQPSKNAHRINLIGRFNVETLEEIAQRMEIDYGYETNYGVQNLTTDGIFIYGSFYAVGNAPQIVQFDSELRAINTYHLSANQGFDVIPPSLRHSEFRFVWAKTVYMSNPIAICCNVDFWSFETTKVQPVIYGSGTTN